MMSLLLAGSSDGSLYVPSTWLSSPKCNTVDSYDTPVSEPTPSDLVLESDTCQEWEMGRCSKGEKCRFRHKRDIRAQPNSYGVWLLSSALNLQKEAGDVTTKGVEVPIPQDDIVATSTLNTGGKHESMKRLGAKLPFQAKQKQHQVENEKVNKQELEDEIEVIQAESSNRVKIFEQLGKRRRAELAVENVKKSGAFRNEDSEEGGAIPEDSGDGQKQWVAGKLEELGRKRRKQRLDEQDEEIGEGIMREEADLNPESNTTHQQFIVLESNLVIYGPGFQILQITPGYDLCQISMRLPIGADRAAITTMLLEQGLKSSDFHILKFSETGRRFEAIILTSIRFGQLLERNKSAFRNHNVTFHVRRDAIWTTGTMQGAQPSLTLTWDSKTNQNFWSASSGSADAALATVYDNLSDSKGAQMETFCLMTSETGSAPNQGMLMVEFDTWDEASNAARTVQANRPKAIPSLVATTPNPYRWSIIIPLLQYEAQAKQWTGLSDTKRTSRLEIKIAHKDVVIHVHGDDMTSAGALKVRVEKLARGEILEGVYWHPSFAFDEESAKFLKNVAQSARVYLACHPDSRTLRAYGESERIDVACKMIKTEVNRREQVMTKTTIPDASDDFFVRGGFEKVKELVGEENVDWRITSRWSVIRMKGGEEATHHLRRLIKESLRTGSSRTSQDETTCPVCFTDTPYPEMLECGHGYCSGCLDLFLKAAADTKKFPIVCVGEDATCNFPIALPFIRRFLPHHTFKLLLEGAFAAYLEQNPTQFRYCKTPDCRQTYHRQSADHAATITCPSCFVKTCSGCSEYHENMTCEEYRISREVEEQERLNDALASTCGYKRCPRCAVWVEKTGGCNHMSCKCGAHICWVCLGIFDASAIYYHIRIH